MQCVIAAENNIAPMIIEALQSLEEFSHWQFKACATYQELLTLQGTRPDVIAISRFLPGEKHPNLLRNVPLLFPGSRIVLIIGEIDEEARAYEKLAENFGLYNIVKGPLPGLRPYNLPTALLKDIHEVIQGTGERPAAQSVPLKEHYEPVQETIYQEKNSAAETPSVAIPETLETVKRPEMEPEEPVVQVGSHLQVASLKGMEKRRVVTIRRTVRKNQDSSGIQSYIKEFASTQNYSGKKGISVVVVANKGGVGKTSVLVKLAKELTDGGISTCIVDLDLHDPSIAVHYKIKDVPGLEVLAKRPAAGQLIDDILQEKGKNLFVLPGIMDKNFAPYLEQGKVTQILDYLTSKYSVVLVDTPAQFWAQGNLHLKEAFKHSGLILAVVDQSPYSEESTRIYGPKILAFGGKVENIRLILNRYKPELHGVKEVEKYFNDGFKNKVARVVWVIPENWVEFVKSAYKGKTVETNDSFSQCQLLVREIAEKAGCAYIPPAVGRKKEKNGLFGGVKKTLCSLLRRS